MKRSQEYFSNLDFTRFFPVQHKATEAYYAIDVTENPDFDKASQSDSFLCYPMPRKESSGIKAGVILPKAELQPIPLML